MKKILLFNISEPKLSSIKALCAELTIEPVIVGKSSFSEPIISIASGNKPVKINDAKDFAGEMMVFSELASEDLDMFLKLYRQMKLPPVSLKAVVTEYNKYWTASALYEELVKEHLYMNGQKS